MFNSGFLRQFSLNSYFSLQKPLDKERAAAALRNARAAKQRHQAAILKESAARNENWQKENAHIISRKNALEVEK